MAIEPNNSQMWEVAGFYCKASTPEEALKYAKAFIAGPDGSRTDTCSLTMADVKPCVTPPSERIALERLRQLHEIMDALTLCERRFWQLDAKLFNLRLKGAHADELTATVSELEQLRVRQRALGERLQAWIQAGGETL